MNQDPLDNRQILLVKAPDDPKEKDEWAHAMLRIQFAMWVDDGAKCAQCGHVYESTDDMMARNPRAGQGIGGQSFEDSFVDDACYRAYAVRKGLELPDVQRRSKRQVRAASDTHEVQRRRRREI